MDGFQCKEKNMICFEGMAEQMRLVGEEQDAAASSAEAW